ncbi:glycosyltransferase family 4 protein [Flavobacteriaceae bacterium S356]|uniref:Glycosyltransferase family 4 protein n=1 Tax=Asprobacillus argus TaxID=3076534 RepID=A0ABU3LK41_9FLAO|nr:glycosyltransferase family 4 protein [Flavobacteriaceae bacterium S356]
MKDKITYIHTSSLDSRKANLIQVLNMCKAFVENGAKVVLILPKSKSEPSIELDPRVTLKFFDVNHKLPSSIKYSFALNRYLNKNKLEGLVFVRQFTLVFPIQQHGYNYIYESHNNNLFSRKYADIIFKFFLKRLIKKDNFLLFFSISGELNKYWDRFFNFKHKKLDYYHDGIDDNMFKDVIKKEEALKLLQIKDSKRKRVTYAGSLYKDRGIHNIVKLASDYPEVDIIVIGGPNVEIPELKELAKGLHASNIEFIGVVEHKQIPLYLYASDILLAFWSNKVKTINYCSPLKVFEYMASERLIIAHAYPTIKEVLNDGNSILINTNCYNSMKEGLQKAINTNPDQISSKARQEVLAKYTWNKRAEYILDIIKKE